MLNIERPIAHQSSITFFVIHPVYVIDNSCIQRITQQMRHEYVLTKTSIWRVFTVKMNGIEIEYQQLKSTNTLPERMD